MYLLFLLNLSHSKTISPRLRLCRKYFSEEILLTIKICIHFFKLVFALLLTPIQRFVADFRAHRFKIYPRTLLTNQYFNSVGIARRSVIANFEKPVSIQPAIQSYRYGDVEKVES